MSDIYRRQFLAGAAILALPRFRALQAGRGAAAAATGAITPQDMVLVNGKIYTMDASKRVVSQVLIRNGRFAAVGNNVAAQGVKRIDLKGRTVIPGIIDAHDHIVLVGNRPGWHVLQED